MAVIALKCPLLEVHVVDVDEAKIDRWNSNHIPIYEPGLFEIIQKC